MSLWVQYSGFQRGRLTECLPVYYSKELTFEVMGVEKSHCLLFLQKTRSTILSVLEDLETRTDGVNSVLSVDRMNGTCSYCERALVCCAFLLKC